MIFRMTETERAVRKVLYVRRWRTTIEVVRALGYRYGQFSVAQALYYLHRHGKASRQSNPVGLGSRWRKA